MTIELVTGSPGAGKTTFVVATRIAKEVGRQFALDDQACIELGLPLGHVVTRRIVQAGIRGLLVEHERLPHTLTGERLDADAIDKWNAVIDERTNEPVHKRLPSQPPRTDVEPSLFNWWLWCKPGDLIVVDEVQFIVFLSLIHI